MNVNWVPIMAMALPILGLLTGMIGILTTHQRKMAELMHERYGNAGEDSKALRERIDQLQAQVNQQALQLEDMRSALEVRQEIR